MVDDSKRYTRADVASRNGQKGAPLWMIYKDVVYDVSSFLKEHPGGEDTIQEYAGKDATKGFEEVGHSSDARMILTKYRIGEIVETKKKIDKGPAKPSIAPVAPTRSPSQAGSSLGPPPRPMGPASREPMGLPPSNSMVPPLNTSAMTMSSNSEELMSGNGLVPSKINTIGSAMSNSMVLPLKISMDPTTENSMGLPTNNSVILTPSNPVYPISDRPTVPQASNTVHSPLSNSINLTPASSIISLPSNSINIIEPRASNFIIDLPSDPVVSPTLTSNFTGSILTNSEELSNKPIPVVLSKEDENTLEKDAIIEAISSPAVSDKSSKEISATLRHITIADSSSSDISSASTATAAVTKSSTAKASSASKPVQLPWSSSGASKNSPSLNAFLKSATPNKSKLHDPFKSTKPSISVFKKK